MTTERNLLYLHKVLHEDSKHAIDDHKDLQKTQIKAMKQLLASMKIEEDFAELLRSLPGGEQFLAPKPNTCPGSEELSI